jgi:hypothetical protein
MADLDQTLQERGKRYGKFTDHARVTVGLKRVLSQEMERRGIVPADDQIEALHMICHKLGRIAAGDIDYADSWHDIAGYAKLVEDRLNEVEQ